MARRDERFALLLADGLDDGSAGEGRLFPRAGNPCHLPQPPFLVIHPMILSPSSVLAVQVIEV
jgi:hypothetical protein